MDEVMVMYKADVALAFARQRDGAANDMRILDGVIAAALLASNDSALNAAVRIPSSLSSGDSLGATTGPGK